MAPPAQSPPLESKAVPIDWGELAPLRLKARAVAEGVYAGTHRSTRRGAGVEFGGHRPYVPGDDLRFFDRRSLLRYDRMMVRLFETETDRALWLCVDATLSMSYRAGGPASKLAYASLIGAALARVALSTGDPVGLCWLGGHGVRPLPPRAGREGFDRLVAALEEASAAGDMASDAQAMTRALAPIARRARRGAVVVLLSDLLDLPDGAISAFGALSGGGRTAIAVQVLDPVEAELDFPEHVRLRSLEGDYVVEAEPSVVRGAYKEALDQVRRSWERDLVARGGRLVTAQTTSPPTELVRRILQQIAGAGR